MFDVDGARSMVKAIPFRSAQDEHFYVQYEERETTNPSFCKRSFGEPAV